MCLENIDVINEKFDMDLLIGLCDVVIFNIVIDMIFCVFNLLVIEFYYIDFVK